MALRGGVGDRRNAAIVVTNHKNYPRRCDRLGGGGGLGWALTRGLLAEYVLPFGGGSFNNF